MVVVTGTLALDMTSTIYGFRLTRWSIDVHSTHMEKMGENPSEGQVLRVSEIILSRKAL